MRGQGGFIPPGGFARWPGNVRGAAWMLASCAGFSLMVALVKVVAREINSFEITFFRCFIGLVCLTPFIVRGGWGAVVTRRPGMHAWRGVLGVFAMACAYFGIGILPMATYTAISFSKPLFAIVLAPSSSSAKPWGGGAGWRHWWVSWASF